MTNKYFLTLMGLAAEMLEQEYKEYYGGFSFTLKAVMNNWSTSVHYREIQATVLRIIEANRETAKNLREYFDSDRSLANTLIDYIAEEIAA